MVSISHYPMVSECACRVTKSNPYNADLLSTSTSIDPPPGFSVVVFESINEKLLW